MPIQRAREQVGVIPITEENQVDRVTLRSPVASICRVSGVPFSGDLYLTYEPDGVLLEFESFESWLLEQSREEETVESLTRFIFNVLEAVLRPASLDVHIDIQTPAHGPASAAINRDYRMSSILQQEESGFYLEPAFSSASEEEADESE